MSESTRYKIYGLIALMLYLIVSNMTWNDEIAVQHAAHNYEQEARQ